MASATYKPRTGERYFNFPVQLLSGYLRRPLETLDNIVDYALYRHAEKSERNSSLSYMERIRNAATYFKISVNNFEKSYKNGQMLDIRYGRNCPVTGISRTILLSFQNNHKTEFDHICLLAFLAVKSILGTKIYCKTNNAYLWSRMDGQIRTVSKNKLSVEVQKFANDYQTRKIKDALEIDWYLKTYSSYMRGFYVSFNLTMESLIFVAETQRQSNRVKELKLQKKNAIVKAKISLENNFLKLKNDF